MSRIPLGILASSLPSGGNALTLISTTILNSTSSSVTFSSIPATYKHLQIRFAGNSTTNGSDFEIQFNSDTATNYSTHWLVGTGSSVSSAGLANQSIMLAFGVQTGMNTTATTAVIVDILDYANTNKYKTMRSLAGTTTTEICLTSGSWRSNTAVSSITLKTANYAYTAGSRFSLYGVS